MYKASASHWYVGLRAQHIGTGGVRLHIRLHQVRRLSRASDDNDAQTATNVVQTLS